MENEVVRTYNEFDSTFTCKNYYKTLTVDIGKDVVIKLSNYASRLHHPVDETEITLNGNDYVALLDFLKQALKIYFKAEDQRGKEIMEREKKEKQ